MSEQMVTISKEEYDKLVDRDFKLSCLEAGGVDNWEWYSDSLEDHGYFDTDEEDEFIQQVLKAI